MNPGLNPGFDVLRCWLRLIGYLCETLLSETMKIKLIAAAVKEATRRAFENS
jgi:hypothetical protein